MVTKKSVKLAKAKVIQLGKSDAMEVVDQPPGQKAFVSEKPDALTNFQMARRNGVYGFLAHNFLAGKRFSKLRLGQKISITDENEDTKNYKIKSIQKYQALDPSSQRSHFKDLKNNKSYSPNDMFKHLYTGSHRVVLQTCITKDGNEEWGRMFIIAEPL